MRRLIPHAILPTLLVFGSCGGESKSKVHADPQTVVDAWIAGAKAGTKDAMLELFVPAVRDVEGKDENHFTAVVANLGARLASVEVRTPLKVEGDKASIAYGSHFTLKGGEDQKEGLRFSLVKLPDGWFIESLR